ncbi:MAG: DMT family transporter [bacterium]|nr:DMT family transporter [bacterium]
MLGAILFSLYAHIGLATSNLAGAVGSRKISAARMSLYAWLAGCLLAAAATPFLFNTLPDLKAFVVTAFLAVIMAVAYPIFLYTLEHGNATINGVIGGTFPIWVVILSLLFFDERLSIIQAVAVVFIFAGVVLSTLHLTRRTKLKTMFNRYSLLAFLVSILWGVYFTFIRYPVEQYGWFETNVVVQFVASIFSILILMPVIRRSKPLKFKRSNLRWPAINAFFGFSSSLSYNYALTLGASSIVAPIAGSYPGLYALMSYFIFKEKLTKLQLLGLVLVLIGVITLSVVSV